MSEDDAKTMAHAMVNWIALAVFAYCTCLFGCLGGCCLYSINKAKYYQKLSETYSQNV
jgi:hypothetical protein